jgi:hypothetical protein
MPVTIEEMEVDVTPPPAAGAPAAAPAAVDLAALIRQLAVLLVERDRIRARLVAD